MIQRERLRFAEELAGSSAKRCPGVFAARAAFVEDCGALELGLIAMFILPQGELELGHPGAKRGWRLAKSMARFIRKGNSSAMARLSTGKMPLAAGKTLDSSQDSKMFGCLAREG